MLRPSGYGPTSASAGLSARRGGVPTPGQLAVAVAVSAAGGLTVALTGDWRVPAGLFATAGFVALGLLRPALFLTLFLLLRPLLDEFSTEQIGGVPSLNPAGAFGAVLIGVAVVVMAGGMKAFRPAGTPALVAVLVVSAAAAGQAAVSEHAGMQSDALGELVRLAALVAIYVLAANLFTRPEAARRLFVIVGLSAVVPAVVGLVQWLNGPDPLIGHELGRISGTFAGPLPFSAYLAASALILVALPAGVLPRWVRLWSIVLVLAALTGTYSREGWVLFLLGLVLLEWRGRKHRLAMAAAVAVVLVATVPAVAERALPSGSGSGDEAYESWQWRVSNWAGLLETYAERPLTGHGLQATRFVNPRAPVQNVGQAGGGYDAHNTVVRLLVDGGIPLLTVWVAVVWLVIRRLRHIARGPWGLSPLARVVALIWICLVVIGLTTDDPLEATAMMYAVLALTGAVEGSYRRWSRTGAPAAAVAAGS